MIRFLVELLLGVAVICVFVEKVAREWSWFAANGALDYFYIAGGIALFVAMVFILDRLAEESGLILHHWWED